VGPVVVVVVGSVPAVGSVVVVVVVVGSVPAVVPLPVAVASPSPPRRSLVMSEAAATRFSREVPFPAAVTYRGSGTVQH